MQTLQQLPPNNAGGARPCLQASMQSLRKANTFLPCCRQVCTTVSTRSTNRLPCGLSVPPLVLRHNTPCRSARSPALLVGSTPSTSTNVHSHFSWPPPALFVLGQGLDGESGRQPELPALRVGMIYPDADGLSVAMHLEAGARVRGGRNVLQDAEPYQAVDPVGDGHRREGGTGGAFHGFGPRIAVGS